MNKKILSIFAILVSLFLVQIAYAVPFTISGTITGQGVPINGATVSVLRIPGNILESTTTTAADGTYSLIINNVAAIYQIKVDAIGIYTGDPGSPGPITTDIIKNFDLVPISTVTVSGTIVDNLGAPINNVAVSFLVGTSLVKTVFTDAAGDYSTTIGDGQSYNIEAAFAGYETGKASITTASSNIDLDFTLNPPCPDVDGDGFDDFACGGTDLNDADNTIYPGATEICGDGIDQDCDGSDLACPVAASSGGGGGGGGGDNNHEYANQEIVVPAKEITPVIKPVENTANPVQENTPEVTSETTAIPTGGAITNLVKENPVAAAIVGLLVLGSIAGAVFYFRKN